MNLIYEIKSDLLKQNVELATILRKTKVLASKLNNKKLKEWVDNELNGYEGNDIEIPKYRKLMLDNYGNFMNPFGMPINNAPIPISGLPDTLKSYVCDSAMREAVKSLESTVLEGISPLMIKWPPDMIAYAQLKTEIISGSTLNDAWQIITLNQIKGILDKIKTNLLGLILELEEKYPELTKSEDTLKEIPAEKVDTIVINKFYGDNTQIASGTNIHQTININIFNDVPKLQEELAKVGIPKEDTNELKKAIDKDGAIQNNNLGKKVSDWIGKTTSKIYSGTIKLANNTTASIVANLIMRYYGLSEQ